MDTYRAHALEGASGVELTIALYDGIIRFMHSAIEAVERDDADKRRASVKRAMDIVIHLQATLNTDVGGKPAESLADFYVAMFALMLQGSQANSRQKFEQVIANVRNVRDAWKQVAADPNAHQFELNQQATAVGASVVRVTTRGVRKPTYKPRLAGPYKSASDCELFFQLLLLVEAGVVAIQCEQLIVSADFDNLPMIEHCDLVGIAHRRYAMRDENRRGRSGVVAQSTQDTLLGIRVNACESVIQDQNRGAPKQGTRNCQALLLSAGKRHAAFPDHGFKSLRKFLKLAPDMRRIGSLEQLFGRDRWHAKCQVFPEGFAEKERLLRHDAHIASKCFQRICSGSGGRR